VNKKPLLYIILSASLFGISTPLSKLLLSKITPIALAGLLYLGAFLGLATFALISRLNKVSAERRPASLERKDIPWFTGAIVAGGIIAPISLMKGLKLTSGFSASLLLNLEGVATVIIAIFFFKENAGKKIWMALAAMTMAGLLLAWSPSTGAFNIGGSLLIVLATVCWGVDNNLTRKISDKSSIQIAGIKGLIAGTISLLLAFALGEKVHLGIDIVYALLLGAFSYGLSLVLFVSSLEGLGASRVGVFYSFGPFIGALLSIVLFKDINMWVVLPAFVLMAIGVWFLITEKHEHVHFHQQITHTHYHRHNDMHHTHYHPVAVRGSHTHEHVHTGLIHSHPHYPDTHHRHEHGSPLT